MSAVMTPTAVAEGIQLLDRDHSLLGCADLFRSGKKPFNVFVMGHTHTALLAEIIIEMAPAP